jgi:ABC-type branched-subunit amino acid transport system ATPase component
MSATPLLSFSEVDAFYGRAQILHRLSFSVGAGERVALLGRNGAGKTTVVNTFLGVAACRAGAMVVGGQRLERPRHFDAARLGVSVVPQGRRILPNLSVQENLLLGAASGRSGPWTVERIFDLFPILRERAESPGTALSGGQQQMLAIGRALMANPAILVLDEPSEGLAPIIVDELGDTLNRLAAEGTGVFLIEQNIGFVRQVAERAYLLSKGSVVAEGRLEEMAADALREHVAV